MSVTHAVGTVIVTAPAGSVTHVLGAVTVTNPVMAAGASQTHVLGTVHVYPRQFYIEKVVGGVVRRPRIGRVIGSTVYWLTPPSSGA